MQIGCYVKSLPFNVSCPCRRVFGNSQAGTACPLHFMLSKCARNDAYNHLILSYDPTDAWQKWPKIPDMDVYYAQLKNRYSNTAYYREVLKECGWFSDYVHPPAKK